MCISRLVQWKTIQMKYKYGRAAINNRNFVSKFKTFKAIKMSKWWTFLVFHMNCVLYIQNVRIIFRMLESIFTFLNLTTWLLIFVRMHIHIDECLKICIGFFLYGNCRTQLCTVFVNHLTPSMFGSFFSSKHNIMIRLQQQDLFIIKFCIFVVSNDQSTNIFFSFLVTSLPDLCSYINICLSFLSHKWYSLHLYLNLFRFVCVKSFSIERRQKPFCLEQWFQLVFFYHCLG